MKTKMKGILALLTAVVLLWGGSLPLFAADGQPGKSRVKPWRRTRSPTRSPLPRKSRRRAARKNPANRKRMKRTRPPNSREMRIPGTAGKRRRETAGPPTR